MNRFDCSHSSAPLGLFRRLPTSSLSPTSKPKPPPSQENNSKDNLVYRNDFQAMLDGLDDEDSIDEINCSNGKKRRLRIDQVQALERIFKVDNKLDPEGKIKLAQELGLQPRQVAIWFQNRRARWKTKQLERDYSLLKSNYEALQLSYSKVEQEKEDLAAELSGLKEKLEEEITETNHSVERASSFLSPQHIVSGKRNDSSEFEPLSTKHEVHENMQLSETNPMRDLKEGLSESDSSGVLNEESNLNAQPRISKLLTSSAVDGLDHSSFSFSSPVYNPPLMNSRTAAMTKAYQQQFLKMEEQNPFNADDSASNMFSVDQAPFFWYFSDKRN